MQINARLSPSVLFFIEGEPGNEADKTLFASVGKQRGRERDLIETSNKDIHDLVFTIFIAEVSHR